MTNSPDCYDAAEFWDLAFDDDTIAEADFVEACVRRYTDGCVQRLLEPGCGGGRLVLEFARRGYQIIGWDLSGDALTYVRQRLEAEQLTAVLRECDMAQSSVAETVDVAYCFVNTFRHMLTEDEALSHLNNIADSLRTGGLYIIGMHLLPPDADEEDEESWSVTKNGTTVSIDLTVKSCDRSIREETLGFVMTALQDAQPARVYQSDYRMRTYEAAQFSQLLAKVPRFELLDVFDFWYDIEEPLPLSDELGDTVFVLRRNDSPQ